MARKAKPPEPGEDLVGTGWKVVLEREKWAESAQYWRESAIVNTGVLSQRRGHWVYRQFLKQEIRKWLDHSVGKGDYYASKLRRPNDAREFWFRSKAKAALFKLWFY